MMHPNGKLFLFCILAAMASCQKNSGGEYGAHYGSPPSVTGKTLPAENKYFSGEGVSLLPEVKPAGQGATHEIRLDVTHKTVELDDGIKLHAWAFGDAIPGPVIHVKQGDKINFTLTNRSESNQALNMAMPHSIDFHAAMVSPQDKYHTIEPGETLSFSWYANYPGVYMYHCATAMVLYHLSSGMYGMVIVDPAGGYPTRADREYALVQSEFYLMDKPGEDGAFDTDIDKSAAKRPTQVVFNGRVNRHLEKEPLKAKPGERVRLYVLNAGPNDTSSFHVIGTIFDRVWIDGNPANEMRGMQTILLGASSAAIVEFVIPEKGKYVFVDHEFADATMGAMGVIDASGE